MTKREVELKSGHKAVVTVDCKVIETKGDMWEGTPAKKESQKTITIVIGGKTYSYLSVLDPNNKFDLVHINKGAYARLGDDFVSKATYDIINNAIREALDIEESQKDYQAQLAIEAEEEAKAKENSNLIDKADQAERAVYKAMEG